MYEVLRNEGKNPQIVFLHRNKDDWSYEKNKSAIENSDYKNVAACSHVVLKLNGRYFDCCERKFIREYDAHIFVNKRFLVSAIKNAEWNDWFDRKKWLPKIIKFTNIKLRA